MTQIFIPKGSGPLVVLTRLKRCMFPLALIIGTVILAEALWSPLHSRRTRPYFCHEGAVNLPLVAKSTPNPRPAQELPSSSIHWHDESKVAEQQSQLPVQLTHCCGPA